MRQTTHISLSRMILEKVATRFCYGHNISHWAGCRMKQNVTARTKRRATTELNACMLDQQIQQRKESDEASAKIIGYSTDALIHRIGSGKTQSLPGQQICLQSTSIDPSAKRCRRLNDRSWSSMSSELSGFSYVQRM